MRSLWNSLNAVHRKLVVYPRPSLPARYDVRSRDGPTPSACGLRSPDEAMVRRVEMCQETDRVDLD